MFDIRMPSIFLLMNSLKCPFYLLGNAGEGLVELRRIETAEHIAEEMATSRNVVYLPQGQSTLLALPQ